MKTLTETEISVVTGGVNRSDVLNYGAAITAVGAAGFGLLALVAVSPAIAVAAGAFALTSGAMWLGSSMYSIGMLGGGVSNGPYSIRTR